MVELKNYTYDALSGGLERDRFFSFDENTIKLRNRILKEARKKVFVEMDDERFSKSTRRAYEKAMTYYISSGDIVKISSTLNGSLIHNSSEEVPVGDISENQYFQTLSLFISAVTICTRAAVDGGLPELIAYNLSDAYIHEALEIKSPKQIDNLSRAMVYDFTYEVYKYKYRNTSLMVRKCCEYISRHLHDEITMKTLCQLTGKSANYISDCFFKEMKIRPTVYIRKMKLDYACQVIDTADISVSALADLLAFPSTSSFITYFRQEYGKTPLQYKKDIYNN